MMEKTRGLVLTAIFAALILLLGFTPLGLIPLGFINLTILCIPVIVGTLVLGLKPGIALGFCFGLVSTIRAFMGASGLVAPLLQRNPALVIIMSVLPRVLVPMITYIVYHALEQRINKAALPFACAAGSLCNTVFYLGIMLMLYVLSDIDATGVLAVIGGTGLIGGGGEALLAAIVSPPIVLALKRIEK